MTYQEDFRLPIEYLEQLSEQGTEFLPELIRILVNAAMQIGHQKPLGAGWHERTPEHKGYANGFKAKTVQTRVGDITFAILQVREGGFCPGVLEKGFRSERALMMILAEMYVQGVSTRKVKAITKQLCGIQVSSSQVSRAMAQLDEVLEAWRQRPLGEYVYLYLDARYEKVRQDGQVRDSAVLIAAGVNWAGKRDILGFSVALGEQEVHWRAFLQSLVQQGLQGVQLIISDAHPGLWAARQEVFEGLSWQRYQFHLQRNAQAYVPRKNLLPEVADDLRIIFNAPDRATAEAWLAQIVQKYATPASRLADCLETNIPEGLTVFSFPKSLQRRLRTANLLERLSQEVKRRTRSLASFPTKRHVYG